MADDIELYTYLNYDNPAEIDRPWDPRCPAVAVRVVAMIRARMPGARVEHVGSTAVPGCAGKGIVDLLLMYPPGRLAAARGALDGLGFQRQRGTDPFPKERPLRVGSIQHDEATFRLHVHVVADNDPEAAEQLRFRDRLRADPALMEAYVARKRAVLAASARNNIAYNRGKEQFIREASGMSTITDHDVDARNERRGATGR